MACGGGTPTPRSSTPPPSRLAHAAGLGVNTWTVDDPARIAELAAWGVDGIVTNDIPTALAALGR